MATWYAVLGLGAISVELNFLLADAEWERILANCAPAAVVAEERFLSRLRGARATRNRVVPIAIPNRTWISTAGRPGRCKDPNLRSSPTPLEPRGSPKA